MGRAVKPSIEDGTGEVEGVKRTELWDWQECINPLQPFPDRLVGRVMMMVLVVPSPVVDAVVRLRICGTFTRSRFRSTPEDLWYLYPY